MLKIHEQREDKNQRSPAGYRDSGPYINNRVFASRKIFPPQAIITYLGANSLQGHACLVRTPPCRELVKRNDEREIQGLA